MKWNIVKTISGEKDWYFRGEQVCLEHHYIVEGPLYGIARVSGETQEEAHSHAQLIAAAPDLLKALQRLCETGIAATTSPDDAGYVADFRDALDDARAAIAKAKGQS